MFWGLTIEPGKHYTQTVAESFHVSMVALDTRDVATAERDHTKMTQLIIQHDKAEFLVCSLCYSTVFQQTLDLNFTEGEEVTFFTEGRGTLHLTGYLVKDEPLALDPDMMSLEESSGSDGAASDSGDEDEMEYDDDDVDEPSWQELASATLEDDEDDQDDDWKPKEGKAKRKKKQNEKKDTKRLHLEEPEPRKAKQLATLELSRSKEDSSSGDDDDKDIDYNPMDAVVEEADDKDAESDSDDDLIEWEADDDDSDEDSDSEDVGSEDSDINQDAELSDEMGSDSKQDNDSDVEDSEADFEVVLPSLRGRQGMWKQPKTKTAENKLKGQRVLRAREAQSNKVSPSKSPEKEVSRDKENIDRQSRRSRDQSTSETEKPTGNGTRSKTPKSKTLAEKTPVNKGQGKASARDEPADSKTPGGKAVGRKKGGKNPDGKTVEARTPGAKTRVATTEDAKAAEVKTPKAKKKTSSPKTSTPAPKTPTRGTDGRAGQEEKTPKQRAESMRDKTPRSLKKEMNQQPAKTPKKVKLPGGTVIEDLVTGDGKMAKGGKMVHVYYRGTLVGNGKEFDSCLGGKPFMFRLGRSEVIKGWDAGISGMKVGGKRRLTVPAAEGYGRQKMGPIPPNSSLVFNVELKNVT